MKKMIKIEKLFFQKWMKKMKALSREDEEFKWRIGRK